MPLERHLTLWTVEQNTSLGLPQTRVLTWPTTAWVGTHAETMAGRFMEAARLEWFEQGKVMHLLEVFPDLQCSVGLLDLKIPAKRNLQQEINLKFDVVFAILPAGEHLAFLPLLGVSAIGNDVESAKAGLERRLRGELGVRNWLSQGRALWPLQIAQGIHLHQSDHTVLLHTFSEVRELTKVKEEAILPRLATVMTVQKPAAFYRETELDAISRVVQGRFPRSLLLIGPSGVGRTTLLREAVYRKMFGNPPNIRMTTASRMVQVLTTSGGWQEGLAKACGELSRSKEWLFVNHLAELFEVGRYVGNDTSMGEYLRPFIGRGDVRLCAEATPEEVARLEARYPGWLDNFVRVPVAEPTAQMVAIVEAWAAHANYQVPIEKSAISEILRLGRRFTPYSGFPGKAIRFLEAQAGGRQPYEGPLNRDAVVQSFCQETGLPREMIDPSVLLPVSTIQAWFDARVYGQTEAVQAVVETLSAVKADVSARGKPIASLLLVGPTGVGKTETARALATFLFGDPNRMVRFDMSEFSSPHAVLRMIGVQEEEGLLTGAVRRQPFCVLLFDEVEKAHPSFLDLLLQLLGEGRLSDGHGRLADFCSTLVLLTSNVGAGDALKTPSGFSRQGEEKQRIESSFRQSVMRWLRPELFNRLDRVLPYGTLPEAAVEQVLDRELAALKHRPGLRDRKMQLSPETRAWLRVRGIVPAFGARPLQRTLQDSLVAPLARALCAWKRPQPPAIQIALGKTGPKVELIEVASPPELDAAPFEKAQDYRRRAQQLRDSAAWARLEALAHQERRRRKDERPEVIARLPEVALLRELEEAAQLAMRAEMEAGANFLQDTVITQPSTVGALQKQLIRRLVDCVHPETRTGVVAIYGLDVQKLELHSKLYTNIAESLGCTVSEYRVYLRTPPEKGQSTFKVISVEERVPQTYERLGTELEITGLSAALFFSGEMGLHEHTDGRNPAIRLKVERHQGTIKSWEKGRPSDIHRRSYYEGKPRRTWSPRHIVDIAEWNSTLQDIEKALLRLTEENLLGELNTLLERA